MPVTRIESLRIKAKLLQKAKKRAGQQAFALKDAFAILATAAGFHSWQEMKATIETHEILRPAHASAVWSVWYNSYEEGKAHLSTHGGFLLPYQKQFFICDANYLSCLGLSVDDLDLAKVGNDWVKPLNKSAWNSLLSKIKQQGAHS